METALQSEFNVAIPDKEVSTAGRTDRAIIVDYLTYCGIEEREDIWSRFMAAYLRHLPEQLSRAGGLVLPGVQLLLDTLSVRDDVILGLLTGNFREGARLKLEHYGLYHRFEFGGFGDSHLDRDDVARDALAQLHEQYDGLMDSSRVWVIGDTPADVRCGRAIGADVVAVATGLFTFEELEHAQPDHLLSDFSDPGRLLGLLGS